MPASSPSPPPSPCPYIINDDYNPLLPCQSSLLPFEDDTSSSSHTHTHTHALDLPLSCSQTSSSSSHIIVEDSQSIRAFGGLVPQALLAHILDETLPAQGRIDALKILETALQEQAEHSPLVLRAYLKPILHFLLVLVCLPSSPLTHLAAFSTLRVLVDLGGSSLDLYIDDILPPLLFELLLLHYQDAEGTAAVLSILGRLCQHVGLKHLLPHLSRPRQGSQDGDNEINAWTHPHPSVRAAALRLLLAGLLLGSKAPTSIGGIDPHTLLKLAFSLWHEDESPEIVRLAKAAVCLIYQCYYEKEDEEDEETETMEDEFYVIVLAEDENEKEVLECLQEFVPPILTAEGLVVLHEEGEGKEDELKFPVPPTPAPEAIILPPLPPPPPPSPSVDRSKLAMLKHKITMEHSPPSSPQRPSLPTPTPPPPSPSCSLPSSPPSPSSSSPRRRVKEKVFVKWNDDEENEQDTNPLITTTTTTTTAAAALLPSPLPSPARRRRVPFSPSAFSPSPSSSFAAASSPTTTEYLATADILPLPDAPHDLPLVLSSLQNDDWPEIFQTLTSVRRLALHHAHLLHDLSVLQLLLRQVLRHIENLRSAVAKNALLALADVWFGLLGGHGGRHEEAATMTTIRPKERGHIRQSIHTYQQLMESELGSMTPILVKRSCDTSGFLVEAAESALNAIVIYTPNSSRVLQSFLPMSTHRNPAMRSKIASLVLRCLFVMLEKKLSGDGSGAPSSPFKAKRSSSKNNLTSSSSSCFIHNKDLLARVVHTAQQWVKDANAETRAQARLIWEVLASENVIKVGGA